MHGDIFYMYQTTLVSVTVDSGLIRSHGRESDENPGQEEQAPTSDADKTRIGACRRVCPWLDSSSVLLSEKVSISTPEPYMSPAPFSDTVCHFIVFLHPTLKLYQGRLEADLPL